MKFSELDNGSLDVEKYIWSKLIYDYVEEQLTGCKTRAEAVQLVFGSDDIQIEFINYLNRNYDVTSKQLDMLSDWTIRLQNAIIDDVLGSSVK